MALGLALGLTTLFAFELLNFNRVYRRVTGDKTHSYLSPNRWVLFGLLLRPHPEPALARLRARALVVLGMWLASLALLLVTS